MHIHTNHDGEAQTEYTNFDLSHKEKQRFHDVVCFHLLHINSSGTEENIYF